MSTVGHAVRKDSIALRCTEDTEGRARGLETSEGAREQFGTHKSKLVILLVLFHLEKHIAQMYGSPRNC